MLNRLLATRTPWHIFRAVVTKDELYLKRLLLEKCMVVSVTAYGFIVAVTLDICVG